MSHIKFTYKTMTEMFIKKQWQVIQKIMASYSKNNGKFVLYPDTAINLSFCSNNPLASSRSVETPKPLFV